MRKSQDISAILKRKHLKLIDKERATMKSDDKLNENLESFEEDTIVNQSLALVDIVKDLLATTKKRLNRVYVVLIISILSNLVIIGAFLWYESQWTYETTETTTTQTVDGENSQINNVDGNQYNDEATHNE